MVFSATKIGNLIISLRAPNKLTSYHNSIACNYFAKIADSGAGQCMERVYRSRRRESLLG